MLSMVNMDTILFMNKAKVKNRSNPPVFELVKHALKGNIQNWVSFSMKIEVSNGELLDKLSILEIKLERITDPFKINNIRTEHQQIHEAAEPLTRMVPELFLELKEINLKLWDIEDRIREMERSGQFGDEFIQTARSVYINNDLRASIKQKINRMTQSGLTEEKSYQPY